MKICSYCRKDLELSAFHKDNSRPSGLRHICKQCDRIRYLKARNEARKTDLGRKKRSEWNRGRVRSNAAKERERRHSKKFREKYPEKAIAQRLVRTAIKRGDLTQPNKCEKCGQYPSGKRAYIHAHHHDYSKPLDVQWLCIDCHAKEHRSLQSALIPTVTE